MSEVLEDGESIRVPTNLMDHQPGYRTQVADSASHDRAAERLRWVRGLADAWRPRAPMTKEPIKTDPRYPDSLDGQKPSDAAWEARNKALESAWRNPTGSVSPEWATAIERQGETWRGGR